MTLFFIYSGVKCCEPINQLKLYNILSTSIKNMNIVIILFIYKFLFLSCSLILSYSFLESIFSFFQNQKPFKLTVNSYRMARPVKNSARKPCETGIRVRKNTIAMIKSLYRTAVGGDNPSMPISDKLDTLLIAMQKKLEALVVENEDLRQALELERICTQVRNKGIVST